MNRRTINPFSSDNYLMTTPALREDLVERANRTNLPNSIKDATQGIVDGTIEPSVKKPKQQQSQESKS